MLRDLIREFPRRVYDGVEQACFGGKALPVFRLSQHAPIYASFWFDYYRNAAKIDAATAHEERPVFMFALGYQCETAERLAEIQGQMDDIAAIVKKHELYFLCNSKKETEVLGGAGFNAFVSNHNTYLDEGRYPLIKCEKHFDAIYLARFTPCKRHVLAKDIPRLKLIGSYLPSEKDHFDMSQAALTHASWTEKVAAREVPAYLADAHVGLCLSDIEGAMYASCEYLLCGLPVVSTPNLGGRDEFFDPRWVAEVEPDAAAIAAAVEELKSRNIPPEEIRQGTIAKLHEARMRLIGVVQGIYNERGVDVDFSREWGTAFIHKIGLRCRTSFRHGHRILREKR